MTFSILPIDRRKEERSQQPFKNVFLTFGANLEEMGNTSWVINDENHLKLLRKRKLENMENAATTNVNVNQ
jgi:hypothetical protein